jgi:two-component sensor histidine kinase
MTAQFAEPRTESERLAFDCLVAFLAAASTVLARLGIELVVGGVAPFVLTFPAIMIATLVAGGRAGTIAAVCCQLLTIRYVFPNWVSVHGGITTDLANILLSTAALAGSIWATAAYRSAAALVRSQCERRVQTLSLFIDEMDHRTKNNFQIAAGLLAHQSTGNPDLAHELDKAASRLETIASVYQDLSSRMATPQVIDLGGHICRIASLLRTGAAPDHVEVICRVDPIDVPVQSAIVIGIIVNEWVTNALKHAFDDGGGLIGVKVTATASTIEIVVQDDGGRAAATDMAGHGGDLMRSLSEVISARIAISHGNGGTCCTLTLDRPHSG